MDKAIKRGLTFTENNFPAPINLTWELSPQYTCL